MRDIAVAIDNICNASGSLRKCDLLKQGAEIPGFVDVIRFIYNPYLRTGVSEAKFRRALEISRASVLEPITYTDFIDFVKTNNTGSDEALYYMGQFYRYCWMTYGPEVAWVAEALITQKLRIGVSVATLNKVFGKDFIPKIGCMLGTPIDAVSPRNINWPCIVTEKLDGVRRVLVKENGKCRMFSRSGHEDDGAVEILEEAKYLPDNFVYDGELLAEGTFKDSIALRQATNSIANSSGVKTGLSFNVFDMIPVEDFMHGSCAVPALNRKIRLGATLKDDSISCLDNDYSRRIIAFGIEEDLQHIKPVKILGLCNSIEAVEDYAASVWAHGGEGVMLNVADGPYAIKRTKDLIKVKYSTEFILPIIGMTEGEGKYEGSLGALIVDYNGNSVGIGTGFTDAQRQTIWDNKEKFIGRSIELECFGESTNVNGETSLNCPVFLRFVGDEHE